MMELSRRLTAVAEYVELGSKVADIGSDHAFLPIYLIKTGRASAVIAGEVNHGPMEAARRNVQEAGLLDQIQVRLGDGLSVIEDSEVNTVCISGMGGTLITSILDGGMNRLKSVQRLVLQPNVAEKNVREWFFRHGWELAGETILKEEGVIYEILTATPGDPNRPYRCDQWTLEQWFELGPFLWEQKSPILKQKWQEEWGKTERVLKGLEQARSIEVSRKKEEVKERLKWIEEVLTCMQTVIP